MYIVALNEELLKLLQAYFKLRSLFEEKSNDVEKNAFINASDNAFQLSTLKKQYLDDASKLEAAILAEFDLKVGKF
jgi:hypothetical protein